MRLVAVLALAACARGHAEVASDYDPHEERNHPCDPKGADVAQYAEPPALEHELFPDELALRGKCIDEPERRDMTRNARELAMDLTRDVLSSRRECDGICEPMRAALPELDEKHDLEDETLQRECTAAVGKLDARVRGGCRHVCLVDRRRLASKAIFARIMMGLYTFEAKVPAATYDDAQVRRLWTEEKLPLPPRRFHLATTIGKLTTMTAEGAFYPGGPLLRLRLVEGDAGCGQSQWTVDKW